MNTMIKSTNSTLSERTSRRWVNRQAGKVGYALLWLLGIPLPILLVIYLIRGH